MARVSRSCEVCEGLTEATGALVSSDGGRIRRLLIGERVVALCEAHAAEARSATPDTVEELRQSFPEPGGRRSLVARRAPLDRRVFPPRPEGRRRRGRRIGD